MSAIVPFGKYKGRTVDELSADQEYCNWLSAQSWFREKFSYIHQLVVVNHGEPADTPEHNAMQALFLDKRMQAACLAQFERIINNLRDWSLMLANEEIRDLTNRIDTTRKKIEDDTPEGRIPWNDVWFKIKSAIIREQNISDDDMEGYNRKLAELVAEIEIENQNRCVDIAECQSKIDRVNKKINTINTDPWFFVTEYKI